MEKHKLGVSPEIPGYPANTDSENQRVTLAKSFKEMFSGLSPERQPAICPIRDVYASVSDKWCVLIIIFLCLYRVLRFHEIKKYVYGVSPKVLSDRLNVLEKELYITRTVISAKPVKVEYSITPLGLEFASKFIGLYQWIQSKRQDVNQIHSLEILKM